MGEGTGSGPWKWGGNSSQSLIEISPSFIGPARRGAFRRACRRPGQNKGKERTGPYGIDQVLCGRVRPAEVAGFLVVSGIPEGRPGIESGQLAVAGVVCRLPCVILPRCFLSVFHASVSRSGPAGLSPQPARRVRVHVELMAPMIHAATARSSDGVAGSSTMRTTSASQSLRRSCPMSPS